MSYKALRAKLDDLDGDKLSCYMTALDQSIAKHGFGHLDTQERYLFIQGLTRLPESAVDELPHLSETTKKRLRSLRESGLNTYARTAAVIFESLIDTSVIYDLERTPLDDGPAVILVTSVGTMVPTPRPTLGYLLRRRRGLNPPFGQYYVASFLTLLGAETHVFNMAVGESEWMELQETIEELGDRLWFVSFGGNFVGDRELDSVYHVSAMLDPVRTSGISPRLVAGGMGAFFCRSIYLQHTPVGVVIGRYGEPSFGDMIFSSDYRGPQDDRDDITLFGSIPNLHFAVRKGDSVELHSTRVQALSRSERRVLANAFDFRMVPYQEKYWSSGVAISVCSPDDLNIPADLLPSPSTTSDTSIDDKRQEPSQRHDAPGLASWTLTCSTDSPLHPANYLLSPKAVKVMTVFGNCPRGCKHCQFTQFDKHIFFLSPEEVVNQFNRAVEAFPDLGLFLIDDDDFLLRRDRCWNLIQVLRENRPTRGKVFYLESTPLGVEPSILQALHEIGFRGILMGLESPIERIVRHIGKLGPRDDFESFMEAPRISYDKGFFTRVTSIPFYPVITEEELATTLQKLTEFINYGISVTVFPLVMALPGTEFASTREHDLTVTEYAVPDGSGKTIELPECVLVDNPVIRKLSFQSMRETASQLQSILQRHNIVSDYPMPLGVLAFFRSIVQTWYNMLDRSVPDDTLDCLQAYIDTTIAKLVRKHFAQLEVQQSVQDVVEGNERVAFGRLDRWLSGDGALSFVLEGLRMFLDFGDEQEMMGAAQIAKWVSEAGIETPDLHRSLCYCLKRPLLPDQRAMIEGIVG